MNYLYMPFHQHADSGFGATGDAYKEAADYLEQSSTTENSICDSHLPINFLRRHAIELFLKSGIIIFHRVLHLPYGDIPWDSNNPMTLLKEGKWRPLYATHSVKKLHRYHSQLFSDHKNFLSKNTRVNWSFPAEMAAWIDTIESFDPDGTHSRYPVTKNVDIDRIKSSVAEQPLQDLLGFMKEQKGPAKVILSYNENDEIVQSFRLNANPMPELTEALKVVVELLCDCHTNMRGELTGTS